MGGIKQLSKSGYRNSEATSYFGHQSEEFTNESRRTITVFGFEEEEIKETVLREV